MNGPDHYREAERLLTRAQNNEADDDYQRWDHDATVAEAQVHATLALFDRIQEIGDQLDVRPRTHVVDATGNARTMLDDCTDTSDCPANVHFHLCPARTGWHIFKAPPEQWTADEGGTA